MKKCGFCGYDHKKELRCGFASNDNYIKNFKTCPLKIAKQKRKR
tara:strand:+ start:366 stop:497 length:132 start_codon:yes stop_codon:yes gene_type:complete